MKIINNLHAFIWQSMTSNNCNAFLIDGPKRVLIDPGHRNLFEHVRRGLQQLDLTTRDIDAVICTHGHPDHLEAIPLFKEGRTLFTLHEIEWQWMHSIGKSMVASYGIDLDAIQPDFFLREGDLSLDSLDLEIIHTPGHSPGSLCIYWHSQKALFTGDLVFREGIGRTDLPGGDGTRLKESIKRLMDLDVEWLLPGHGDIIKGAVQVQKNFKDIESFWFAYI
jgi:glyoxylase-like metal-dependent hydrolase (beta-lactamase superfamily II)